MMRVVGLRVVVLCLAFCLGRLSFLLCNLLKTSLFCLLCESDLFGQSCLLARRLVERGVRFIQLYHQDWDHHAGLPGGIRRECLQTDQPSAALIADLRQRGMLDDTLVVTADIDQNLMLSARNLPSVMVVDVAHADPVSLIQFRNVILTKQAMVRFEELLK